VKGIPIKNYFEEEIFEKEINVFFKDCIQYIGSSTMLKYENDYRVVERMNNRKILFKNSDEICLMENVCSHRQAKMISGTGNSQLITCPLHNWSFNGKGKCVATPFYVGEKEHCSLKKSVFTNWNNLLFTGNDDAINALEEFPYNDLLNLEKMIYAQTFTEELNFNWKHYVDGFAEDYHVPFVHPGFANFIDLKSIKWIDHALYTGQTFKLKSRAELAKNETTPKYRKWVDEFLKYFSDELPEYGGILIMLYPNIMIEWYPLFMAISTVHPTGPESCINHIDFFHHEDVFWNHVELKKAAEEAYMETADEDAEMCVRLAQGRKILFEDGEDEQGPYQHPFEDGLCMFHRYYHSRMT